MQLIKGLIKQSLFLRLNTPDQQLHDRTESFHVCDTTGTRWSLKVDERENHGNGALGALPSVPRNEVMVWVASGRVPLIIVLHWKCFDEHFLRSQKYLPHKSKTFPLCPVIKNLSIHFSKFPPKQQTPVLPKHGNKTPQTTFRIPLLSDPCVPCTAPRAMVKPVPLSSCGTKTGEIAWKPILTSGQISSLQLISRG